MEEETHVWSNAAHKQRIRREGARMTIISASTECGDAQPTVQPQCARSRLMSGPGTKNAKGEARTRHEGSPHIEKWIDNEKFTRNLVYRDASMRSIERKAPVFYGTWIARFLGHGGF